MSCSYACNHCILLLLFVLSIGSPVVAWLGLVVDSDELKTRRNVLGESPVGSVPLCSLCCTILVVVSCILPSYTGRTGDPSSSVLATGETLHGFCPPVGRALSCSLDWQSYRMYWTDVARLLSKCNRTKRKRIRLIATMFDRGM